MPELRYDPIFAQWTCIAERRQARPIEFQQLTQRRAGIDCPFCRGSEGITPTPVLQWSESECNATNEDWLVRAFPNKFSAFDTKMQIIGRTSPKSNSDVFESDQHLQEVIVLSPRHVASLSGLSDDELRISFAAFQNRLRVHQSRSEIQHVCLFMNCRPMAGASIEHSHFQLIASPVCTDQVRDRVHRMNQPADDDSNTVWQTHIQQELADEVRIIHRSDNFVVYCPFASRYSSQIRIAPLRQLGSLVDLGSNTLWELAALCRQWVDGMQCCLIDDVAYNLIFHSPPTDQLDSDWFVDLVPRLPQAAGLELATDCWVNPVSPETAAADYRKFAVGNQDDGR